MLNGYVPKLPLMVTEEDGPYGEIKNIKDLIRQNLKMVLLTIPGEKMMDLEFGVGLPTYIFENMNGSTYYEIKSKIEEQVSKYMPYLKISSIDFKELEYSKNSFSVSLTYAIPQISQNELLEISI